MNEAKNYVTIEEINYSLHLQRPALFRLTYEVTPRPDGGQRWFLVAMEESEAAAAA